MFIAAAALALMMQVTTVLSPSGDGALSADITLSEARTQIVFEPNNQPQRKLDWSAGDGFTFDGVTLERADGEPFTQAVLQISPDSQFFDRKYVAVEQVSGQGWALFLPAFAVDGETVSLSLSGFDQADILIADGARQAAPYPELTIAPDTGDRLAYIGTAEGVTDGPITLIASNATSDVIKQHLFDETGKAISKLTERFGTPPRTDPVMIISTRNDWDRFERKAGTLAYSTVIFHLRNPGESPFSPEDIAEQQSYFAVHESVHLWNSEVWTSRVNPTQPWLHEGTADYLTSRLKGGRNGPAATMDMRLNGCVKGLVGQPLNGRERTIMGKTAYDCGAVLNFAAEVSSLRNGNGDIFSLWLDVFDMTDDGVYDDIMFLDVAGRLGGEDFTALADRFLTESDTQRWQTLPDIFAPLGITIVQRAQDEREAQSLLFYNLTETLKQFCPAPSGFWLNDRSWKLDTETKCTSRALDGNPEIDRINGFHIIDQPFEAAQSLRESCDVNGDIIFTRLDGTTLPPVTCPGPLPQPVPVIESVIFPDLPPV